MKKIFKTLAKMIFAYALCGGLYLLIEIGFRGYTFLEMYYLAGCVGLIAMFFNNIFSYETDFLLQIFVVSIICTTLEGICGNIYNMDYHMWDYTQLPLSFWNNQINVFFSLAWVLLSAIIIPILDYIDWKLFDYKPFQPPYYKIGKKVIFRFKNK